MMKNKLSILLLAFMAFITAGFVSCSDDDLGKTIFDTTDYPLDRTAYTFPLDTFIKKNFLEPYNLKFIYRMEDIGSDLQKNLVPANYEKSVELAVLSKYLWYDVYQKIAGDEFIKANSPRIIHVIGSPSYNPTDGTETLGTAEGGLKISGNRTAAYGHPHSPCNQFRRLSCRCCGPALFRTGLSHHGQALCYQDAGVAGLSCQEGCRLHAAR